MSDTVTVQVQDSTGATAIATFTIPQLAAAATPTFSPAAGSGYAPPQTITISCATSGATIYYTTNGSTPTTSSPVYTGPFSISINTVVQAIATATGFTQSAVGSATYLLTLTPEWP